MVVGYDPSTKLFQLFNAHGFTNADSPTKTYQSPIVELDWNTIVANFGYWDSGTV